MDTPYELRCNPAELIRSLPLTKKPEEYDGGLSVSRRTRRILAKDGFISIPAGGQEAREAYVDGTEKLDARKLSPFGFLCFIGAFGYIRTAVEAGIAPALDSTETPYKLGYATIVVFGAQQFVFEKSHHLETLKYLISKGLPLEIPDMVGWTALSHAAGAARPQTALLKVLIEGGANVDHQSRFGDVPLIGSFMRNNVKEADLLLEHGANLDIPDADRLTPREFFVSTGPQITAVVQKHIVKRSGKGAAPRTEKCCDFCQKTDVTLSNCSRCRVVRYCSKECQKNAWPQHKKTCVSFSDSTTLSFKPFYNKGMTLFPLAQLPRSTLGGLKETIPERHTRAAHVPKDVREGGSKDIVIKVQVAIGGKMPMLVYDKKRDFVCHITREDSPVNYDRLDTLIREKGVMGLKGYFAAELKTVVLGLRLFMFSDECKSSMPLKCFVHFDVIPTFRVHWQRTRV